MTMYNYISRCKKKVSDYFAVIFVLFTYMFPFILDVYVTSSFHAWIV